MNGPIGPGTVLADRYRLDDLLAESEGARFWRATDTILARSVAVHAVPSDDERAPALLEAARVSATVTDPHLLRVLDCDDEGGITWVVNEWGDGVSLDLMLQQGTLPPSRAAWLTREVADAIAPGHAQGAAPGGRRRDRSRPRPGFRPRQTKPGSRAGHAGRRGQPDRLRRRRQPPART